MNRDLTIVIPSYKSKKLVLSHLINFKNKYKTIIIENSYDKSLKKIIEDNYNNVDIYLKKNIGFGRAINFASKLVKTKFFFVICPDTKIYKNTIFNLLKACKKINKFGMISPTHIKDINKKNYDLFIEKKQLNGTCMLFNTSTFKKINGFDKNIFLYYEENDFFLKCNNLDLKLYLITNSFYNHINSNNKKKKLEIHSSIFDNIEEKNYSYYIGGWHGQWSKFYYQKKYNGYIKALLYCLPNILKNLIQLIPIFFLNYSKAKYKYFKIEGFICSIIGLPSFKRSKFDKK